MGPQLRPASADPAPRSAQGDRPAGSGRSHSNDLPAPRRRRPPGPQSTWRSPQAQASGPESPRQGKPVRRAVGNREGSGLDRTRPYGSGDRPHRSNSPSPKVGPRRGPRPKRCPAAPRPPRRDRRPDPGNGLPPGCRGLPGPRWRQGPDCWRHRSISPSGPWPGPARQGEWGNRGRWLRLALMAIIPTMRAGRALAAQRRTRGGSAQSSLQIRCQRPAAPTAASARRGRHPSPPPP